MRETDLRRIEEHKIIAANESADYFSVVHDNKAQIRSLQPNCVILQFMHEKVRGNVLVGVWSDTKSAKLVFQGQKFAVTRAADGDMLSGHLILSECVSVVF